MSDQFVVVVMSDPASHYSSGYPSGIDVVFGLFEEAEAQRVMLAEARRIDDDDSLWNVEPNSAVNDFGAVVEIRELGKRWEKYA